ncbi:MAG: hypothetical protein ACLFSK_07920 [Ectothiorhodospira sp.]
MRVVSNSSPLIFLGKLDVLSVLADCFESVAVPDAVVEELQGQSLPGFIKPYTLSVGGQGFVEGALGRLHRGELAAMRLALEQRADLLLMDDLAARLKAGRLGVNVMGTLGVLLLANHRELLLREEVTDMIERLRHRHNLYLTEPLVQRITAALR